MFSYRGICATKVVSKRFLVMYLAQGAEATVALVFRCVDRRADDIARGIAEGFKVSARLAKKNTNPFAAVGGRTSAPPSLFAKQVHRSELKPICELGAGAFGVVHKGEQTSPSGEKGFVAVKCLRQGASDADKEEFVREAEACLKFDHENVCVCIGVAVQQRPWLIVLEFIEVGDVTLLPPMCLLEIDHLGSHPTCSSFIPGCLWSPALQYGDVQSVLEQATQKKCKLHTTELLLLCHGIVKGMVCRNSAPSPPKHAPIIHSSDARGPCAG